MLISILLIIIGLMALFLLIARKQKRLLSLIAIPFLLTGCGSDKCVIS